MDAYPLTFDVMPPEGPRNRLTRAFRIILADPALLLVGGPGRRLGREPGRPALLTGRAADHDGQGRS